MFRSLKFNRNMSRALGLGAIFIALVWISSEWWTLQFQFDASPDSVKLSIGQGVISLKSGMPFGLYWLGPQSRGISLSRAYVYAGQRRFDWDWPTAVSEASGYSYLAFPLWIPFLFALIGFGIFGRLSRKSSPGCCCECGYNLTGNMSGICSECGALVDRGVASPNA